MNKKLICALLALASLTATATTPAGNPTDTNSPNCLQADIRMEQDEDNRLVITGCVTDRESRETLAGVSIMADGQKVYSDLDGEFAIPVAEPGIYQLTVELISYQTAQLEVTVQPELELPTALAQK